MDVSLNIQTIPHNAFRTSAQEVLLPTPLRQSLGQICCSTEETEADTSTGLYCARPIDLLPCGEMDGQHGRTTRK
jgi:hypothetical protein